MKLACDKCKEFGFGFYSEHITPEQYIEGNPKAEIWIVGLNPKSDVGSVEGRTPQEFENFDPDCHPYFSDFNKASDRLYQNWKSNKSNVAHTDIVKCFSNSFPPKINENGKERKVKTKMIVNNCIEYLKNQIKAGKPKMIICNGSIVSWEMIRLFPPKIKDDNPKTLTSYKTSQNISGTEHNFWIVLSGFIGRIDDRNKRRLGKEIEDILNKENIELL